VEVLEWIRYKGITDGSSGAESGLCQVRGKMKESNEENWSRVRDIWE
jgi:hypothetical protein